MRHDLFFHKSRIYSIILISSIILLVILLFFPSFTSYFFQDDWFSFSISQVHSLRDFFDLFAPRNDVIYYRPLGMQVPFFLVQSLFGLNPLPFRVATLLVHFVNGLLVYKILHAFLQKKYLALFGSLLYLTSATHMIVFFWAATFAFVLGPFFYFSSFYAYIVKRKRLSFMLFIFGLFTNELLISLPIIIGAYELLNEKRLHINKYLLFFLGSFLYGLFRLTIASFSTAGGYALIMNVKQIIFNLRNYTLWATNWPDTTPDHLISFLTFNPLFVSSFTKEVLILTLVTVLFWFTIIISYAILARKNKKNILAVPFFGLIWFLISLGPVLYFSHHYYTYYVPIPLIGLLIAGLYIINKANLFTEKKLRSYMLLGIFFFVWYMSSYKTIRLNQFIHWAPQRAVQSKILVTQTLQKYPTLPDNATVFITDGKKTDELKWALGEENAMKVIYSNPTIKTYFGSTDDYFAEFDISLDDQNEVAKSFFLIPK